MDTKSTIKQPPLYAKAIIAAVIAFLGTGATAAADGQIETGEWWAIGSATAVAFGAVYGVPNRQQPHA